MKRDQHSKTYQTVLTAIIAALYVALGLIFGSVSFGAIQVRVSCAMFQLVAFNKKYFWGVLLGNAILNLFSPLGWYDMVFGVATSAFCAGVPCLINYFVKNLYARQAVVAVSSVFFSFFVAWELVLVAHVPFLLTWGTVAIGQAISQAIGIPLTLAVNKRVHLAEAI